MAAFASMRKMPKPGVSSRLIFVFFHSTKAMAAEIECLRSISSGSKSVVVVPSSMRPRRVVAPALNSSCDTSVVLPVSLWPTTRYVPDLGTGIDLHERDLAMEFHKQAEIII